MDLHDPPAAGSDGAPLTRVLGLWQLSLAGLAISGGAGAMAVLGDRRRRRRDR